MSCCRDTRVWCVPASWDAAPGARGSCPRTGTVGDIYFDSAYIAKFYLTEPDGARVKALAESEGQVCCSIVGRVEVAQVLHRKFREEQINREEARALFDQFRHKCSGTFRCRRMYSSRVSPRARSSDADGFSGSVYASM
ncbi:MAG: type II toxin-antitoxin system VapC family toxin [Betaproteobacteria bacterium]|nr:type II toxin-antitoxin system VapC family toxin [Betaproteobacteria bacterium]